MSGERKTGALIATIISFLLTIFGSLDDLRGCNTDAPEVPKANCSDANRFAVQIVKQYLAGEGIDSVEGPVFRWSEEPGGCKEGASSYTLHGYLDFRDSTRARQRYYCAVKVRPANPDNSYNGWVADSLGFIHEGMSIPVPHPLRRRTVFPDMNRR